jgi:hypothetical protein
MAPKARKRDRHRIMTEKGRKKRMTEKERRHEMRKYWSKSRPENSNFYVPLRRK